MSWTLGASTRHGFVAGFRAPKHLGLGLRVERGTVFVTVCLTLFATELYLRVLRKRLRLRFREARAEAQRLRNGYRQVG